MSIPLIQPERNGIVKTLILVGTSTGGPQALTQLFGNLPVLPGCACCVVQHMPAGFTANLAKRLEQVSQWEVSEAGDRDWLAEGHVYVAPGGFQMRIQAVTGRPQLSVEESGPVNGHQPAVDVMFASAVENWRGSMIGVLMTGMGRDGAAGLKKIQDAGGYTIAEAESSCVVYGMPKAAVSMGAVRVSVPLPKISSAIVEAWRSMERNPRP